MTERTAVVIPTFNEKENIRRLLVALQALLPTARFFVVDDNSPDGTAQVVQELASRNERIRLVWRSDKQGLASAYLDAFAKILPDDQIQYIVTMDADLSHNPGDLPRLLRHVANNDIVIGSRYSEGGKVENWPWHRRFLSKYANVYARMVTGVPVADLTAGFVIYSREILAEILQDFLKSEGYAFQIEMKYLAHRKGAKIQEVPIVFQDRTSGKSKLGTGVIWEGIFIPWYLRFRK